MMHRCHAILLLYNLLTALTFLRLIRVKRDAVLIVIDVPVTGNGPVVRHRSPSR